MTVVITAPSVDLAQIRLSRAMNVVSEWMTKKGLELALHKTEILLLTRKRKIDTEVTMTVRTQQVRVGRSARYLGVTLDTKLSFWPHIRNAMDRAAQRTAALSRLMLNMKGPRPSTRRLLMTVTHSILLYGAEVWGDAMGVKKYSKAMLAVQRRGALRIACAYRTVSGAAILVIAGVVPIDLLAMERRRKQKRVEASQAWDADEQRQSTMDKWQDRWNNCEQGRWTRRLIPEVKKWTERGSGEVNFYLTQFLSGHGYFRKYLHTMGKTKTPTCSYCEDGQDDVEHTIFVCPRWTEQRHRLETVIGTFTPDDIIGRMTKDRDQWTAVTNFVTTVLRTKNEDGVLDDEWQPEEND